MRLRPRPVSMLCAGSGVSVSGGSWSYCMKTRFQNSRKRSFSPPGRSSRRAERRGRGRGTAREHGPHGPVGPACQKFSERGHSTIRSRGTPTACHASIASSSGPRPSSSSPSKTVTQTSSASKPKPSGDELPRELDGALLEVVADREVAEHLEERQVARGRADVVDVDRAEALLAARQARRRRLLLRRGSTASAGASRRSSAAPTGRTRPARATPRAAAGGRAARRTQERLADLVGGHRHESAQCRWEIASVVAARWRRLRHWPALRRASPAGCARSRRARGRGCSRTAGWASRMRA